MAAAAAANMRAAAGGNGGGHPSELHQQHYQQQQQQGPPQLGSPGLPEAAPSTKTDPVELSLLTTYLRVVRQTQVSNDVSNQVLSTSFVGTVSHVAA
jgi:hypothetical protein